MPVKSKFHFPVATLTQEGDYIVDAAEAHAADISGRLPENFVANQRALLEAVRGNTNTQKSKTANVGGYTVGQNDALTTLNDLVSRAKESAKRAFKGQDVKLRNEFQVGINSPGDLASVLQRARIVRDSATIAGNATALTGKGWLATDTTALTSAINALDQADDTQETAKTERTGSTDARNTAANELYEGLLTIQNAANNQWPERVTSNATVRAQFRLNQFPPRSERKKQQQTTTPTTANT
jgi:hypothetical protein